MNIKDMLEFIAKHVTDVKEWEMTCIESYRRLRGFKKAIEGAIKEIESDVIWEVEQNKQEYLDFSVSTRTTYNYKDSTLFLDKQSELKEIEKTLKVATDMNSKWDTYCDSEWNVIEPVGLKYTQVLTYKPRG